MYNRTSEDKSDTGDSADNRAIDEHAHEGEGEATRGALELEYPSGNGLYSDIFETFNPEVADELIDTRTVRMLVELEYNCRRILKMLSSLSVDEDVLVALEESRQEIAGVLWATCGELAADYSVGESVEWTPASEMF